MIKPTEKEGLIKLKRKKKAYLAVTFIALFLLWTILVKNFDVGAIGPNGSQVGFSSLNALIHRLTGVNMSLYVITDWLGIIPLLFILGFGVFGLTQWVKRKSIRKVDFDILALGEFYIAVMGVYLIFEKIVINYRPVLIEGFLEASYPSSTTMLVMCVIPTAIMDTFWKRIPHRHMPACKIIWPGREKPVQQ